MLFGANDMGSLMIEENVVAEAGTVHYLTLPRYETPSANSISHRGNETLPMIWSVQSAKILPYKRIYDAIRNRNKSHRAQCTRLPEISCLTLLRTNTITRWQTNSACEKRQHTNVLVPTTGKLSSPAKNASASQGPTGQRPSGHCSQTDSLLLDPILIDR